MKALVFSLLYKIILILIVASVVLYFVIFGGKHLIEISKNAEKLNQFISDMLSKVK